MIAVLQYFMVFWLALTAVLCVWVGSNFASFAFGSKKRDDENPLWYVLSALAWMAGACLFTIFAIYIAVIRL